MNGNVVIAFTVLLVTFNLYRKHQQPDYQGPFNQAMSYDTISPMKHDLFKQMTLDLFPALVYTMTANEFYNPNDLLNSFVGKAGVTLAAYVVYYQFVEPYSASQIRAF